VTLFPVVICITTVFPATRHGNSPPSNTKTLCLR
jgi:hypothetical protein